MEVEDIFQISLSAIVGTKEFLLKFYILHKKIEKIVGILGTSVAMARFRCYDNACLDKKYWTNALNMAFFVKNMFLHSVLQKTPFEMMYNNKPNSSFVKLFGCVAFMHIEKPFRKSLDQTSKKGFFHGNFKSSKYYLIGSEVEKGKIKIRKLAKNVDLMKRNITSNIRRHKIWSKTLIMIQMKFLFLVNSLPIVCFQKH